MTIAIDVHSGKDCTGKVIALDVRSCVFHSPREGLNNAVLRDLENDLDKLINERLRLAMEKGGEK